MMTKPARASFRAEGVPAEEPLRRCHGALSLSLTKNYFNVKVLHTLSCSWWRSWQRLRLDGCGRRRRGLPPPPPVAGVLLGALLVLSFLSPPASGITQEYKPNVVVRSEDLLSQSFHGNQSHVDYFRLLQRDGDSLLIGARNYVYNISVYDLSEHTSTRIVWVSRRTDSDMCFSKGKSEAECHNYIRVLAKKSEGEFLVCGTNAYKPTCRDYTLLPNNTFTFHESSGVGKSPYDPRHNSTFVFAEGQLYSGTVVDFQGMMPLILRDPLKTDHTDYRQLNGPDFVHSFEYGAHVFFFFRETAVEYMNCGKRVYSRVARVCKRDRGLARPPRASSHAMSAWTTFLKTRLNCSFPGQYPFYFDEIQSVSDVVSGVYGGAGGVLRDVIYAVFTTPPNSIPGSAVCAFAMRDVQDAFQGPFKEQKDLNSNWLPVPPRKVPDPRPGACVNDSQTLPQETINFVRAHPLMEDLVSPFLGKPLLMKASFKYRFTKLTVDPQVPLLAAGHVVDVLFVATDVGVVLKVINVAGDQNERQALAVVVEEIHAFEAPASINTLHIARSERGARLVLITDTQVKAIALHRCDKAGTCRECVALQDPYCAYYPSLGVCGAVSQRGAETGLQNVSSGRHDLCPDDPADIVAKHTASTSNQVYPTELPPQPPSSARYEGEKCPPCVCSAAAAEEQPTSPPPPPSDPPPPNPPPIPSSFSSTHLEDGRRFGGVATRAEEGDSWGRSLGEPGTKPPPPGRGAAAAAGGGGVLPAATRLRPAHVPMRAGKGLPPSPPSPTGRGRGRGDPRQRLRGIAISYVEGGITGPVLGSPLPPPPGAPRGPLIYSAETLAIAVTTACVAALVVGFISGFLFSRKCRGDSDFPPHFSDTPYLDSKLNKCENTADPNMYTANNASLPPPKQINNLVTTFNPPKNVNNGKSNTNSAADMKLIKQAKCAYI